MASERFGARDEVRKQVLRLTTPRLKSTPGAPFAQDDKQKQRRKGSNRRHYSLAAHAECARVAVEALGGVTRPTVEVEVPNFTSIILRTAPFQA